MKTKSGSKHVKSNSLEISEGNFEKLKFESIKKTQEKIFWTLPSSKSHFIRWLFLSAQTPTETLIGIKQSVGKDILSSADVLEKLGVKIKKYEDFWVVKGCNKEEFIEYPELLDCGNSATAFRFLCFLVSRNGIKARITGDKSLIKRNYTELFEILEKGGVLIERESESIFPITFSGFYSSSKINVLTTKTSQIISGLVLTMPSSIEKCIFLFKDKIISRSYFELTLDIAMISGAKIKFNDKNLIIFPWVPNVNDKIEIPLDESLLIMPMLLSKLHSVDVIITNWNNKKDILNNHFLLNSSSNFGLKLNKITEGLLISNSGKGDFLEINIENKIDLLTPLLVLMSLSKGGIISGFNHAVNKESNRVESTLYLSNQFGLDVDLDINFKISESIISVPKNDLISFNDHRLQMTAMIMLSYTGGAIDSEKWYEVTDPLFLQKLIDSKVCVC